MKTQKINSKLIPASLFIVLIVSLGMTQSFASVDNASCATDIANQMTLMGSSLDQSKAISLANNDKDLQSKISGYTVSSSASSTWSWNPITCSNLTLEAVNVSYALHNANGYVKNVNVLLDPALTRVISITEHVLPKYTTLPGTNHNPIWSGYEFGANSTGDKPIWQAQATYTLPTIGHPTSKCTSTLPCDLAIWTGLENKLGGSNGLEAHDGTDQQWINCNTTCSYSAWFWYEFYPSAYTCGGITLSNGDSISITTTNEAASGGANNKYDVSMQDTSTGHGCSLTGQTYSLTRPYFAAYIDERATYGGNAETLASFTTNSISGTYDDGSSWSIARPYSNSWYEKQLMWNGATPPNIDVGAVSVGSFTLTYKNSDGT